MSQEHNLKDRLEDLLEKTGELVETGYDLAIIKSAEKTSVILGQAIFYSIVVLFINFIFLFAGFGAATWLGNLLSNPMAGYFLVAAIYLLFIFMLVLVRKPILAFFRNQIVKNLYD